MRASSIAFDRRKYGPELLVDACAVDDIPGFITSPAHPHRLTFHEVALITAGEGELEIDGVALPVAARRVLLTAPGETRRWRLASRARDGLKGMLVFFEADFINAFFADPRFLENMPLFSAAAVQRSFSPPRREFSKLMDVAGSMRDELRAPIREDTGHALRADTYKLLVALQRIGGEAAAPADAARALTRRFAILLEERVALGEGVAVYAHRLGVSPRHLNHCVQRSCGRTVGEAIHSRQLLEARRLLLHTQMGVAEIAEHLNFGDASYFVRFFKRHTGVTPRQFRIRAG